MSIVCEATSRRVEGTEAWGRALVEAAAAPLRVALDGEVGAGKTAFVRGAVAALAPSLATWVSSPTYAVVHHYPTTPPTLHVDLYRVVSADDLASVGFWELDAGGWLFVEWASRVPEVMRHVDVVASIERRPRSRRARFASHTAAGAAALQRLCAKLQAT